MLKQFFHRYRLPILSGILIGTSYIPSYPIATFWAFVPLWIFWMKNFQNKSIFWSGWLTQFILTLIGFHWVAHTAHEFGHLPWALSILALLGFCATANLHIVAAGLVWGFLRRRFEMKILQSALLLATLTTLGEIFFPMIFPWNHGYTWLWADWQGFQFADIIGIQGLSALCLFSNVYFLWLWSGEEKKSPRKRRVLIGTIGFVFAFLIFNYLGRQHAKKWDATDKTTRILVVQANVGNLLKFVAQEGEMGAMKTISDKYFRITRKHFQENEKIDFVLWPETAYPEHLNAQYRFRHYHKKLRKFVNSIETPLITGGYTRNVKKRQVYNSVFFIQKNGSIIYPPYSKSILLAFGEYFPGAEIFPFLKNIVPAISHFERGPGPTVRSFEGVRFGPQICYEGLHPDFTRGLSQKGAQIFFNVTNDSWFGDFFQAYQHLYMTLGRAIEFRRPLLRSTNTGYTTAILANGDIQEMSPIRSEWSHVFELKYLDNPPQTFFAEYGFYIRHLFIGLLGLILLWIVYEQRRSKT